MTIGYIRFSTDSQEATQQMYALEQYARTRGITIDSYEQDEGVSGGVSYKERKLYGVIKKMRAGDILITTEISRLGRSMSDVNMLVSQELKPRKLRLIVVKMGLDLDCSNLKAVDEMLIFAFSFAAQCEKEMIVQRTQSSMDAKKELIRTQGGFVSKAGNWVTKFGAPKGHNWGSRGGAASALKKAQKAGEWRKSSALYLFVENQLLRRRPRREILAEAIALYEKNPEVYCTRKGCALCEGTLSRWANEIQLK